MKVLGIDPGSRITGYGIVEKIGNSIRHIDNGAVFTEKNAALPERIKTIFESLNRIIEQYEPDEVAIENIFFSTNVQSALKLGQARGGAIAAAVHKGLTVSEYTALQVKQAVVGEGKADKTQVQKMVKALLSLPEIAQADASDALAVAICHINSSALKGSLTKPQKKHLTSWRSYKP